MKNIPEEFAPQNWQAGGQDRENFAPAIRLDYGALLARVRRNWYWFVLAIAICIGAAFFHLRYATPVYQAYMSMLIQEQSGGQTGLSKQVIAQELGFENTYVIDNEVYMLRSNFLMQRVVNLLGLDIQYTHLGSVRDVEIYKPENFGLVLLDTVLADGTGTAEDLTEYGSVMVRFDDAQTFSLIRYEGDTTSIAYGDTFAIGSRNFALAVDPQDMPSGSQDIYRFDVMNPAAVAAGYSNALGVEQVERSGVVNLTLTDPVPEKAKDILNALVTVYEQQIVEQQSLTGGQTLDFLQDRLVDVTDELYEVESNVADLKRNTNMTVDLQSQGANYLDQMNAADNQLAELEVRRDLIEDIRDNLIADEENYETLPVSSEIISGGALSQLITEYNEQVFLRSQRLESATPDHPMVATYNERLTDLKSSILRSINVLLRETSERVARIEERMEPLQASMTRMPANEQRLLQIMRQQEIKQNLFMFLLEKREEAALTIAAQVPNTRIIDHAVAGSSPISPNKTITYLFAIGMGLFIPGSLIFLRELLGTTISTEKEILNVMPYPVVGRIIKSSDHHQVIVTKSNRNGAAEAFRLLRTNLGFLLPSEQSSVIMVTSSISGEGKSFIATNLSAALALSRKRVVVIGLDMRKPKLAEMVTEEGLDHKATGLSNYLIGKSTYEEIVRPTSRENLSLITSGPLPPNPAELLMEGRMVTLMHRLRQDFDVIILDAPPVGVVTDGLLMKEFVNVTLFVARLGVTPKKSIGYINEMIQAGKLSRVNLIINGIDPKSSYGYGYGYYE